MKEVLPGLFHWTAMHEKIGSPVHSHFLRDAGVLLDPMLPAAGLDWFRKPGREPRTILLTNRHHWRHSARFVRAFGARVRCHRAGLHEFTKGEPVEAFEWGEDLPGGVEALEVGVLCPEETALLLPVEGGALAFADAVIRDEDGELGFVPDQYIGEDPAAVKRGLKSAFRRLLARDFEHLLFAHGEPWIGGGKAALERFARQ